MNHHCYCYRWWDNSSWSCGTTTASISSCACR